jgi:hypothetical protein
MFAVTSSLEKVPRRFKKDREALTMREALIARARTGQRVTRKAYTLSDGCAKTFRLERMPITAS